MKNKIFVTLLTLICITLLCSCADDSSSTETTGETTTQSTDLAFGDTAISENNEIFSFDADFLLSETDTDITLPIIKDIYPTGHGGAEYEVTEEIKASLEKNKDKMLNLLNIQLNDDQYRYSEQAAQFILSLSKGEQMVIAPDFITYSCDTKTLDIPSNTKQILSTIENEPVIKAMCTFLNITSPQIKIEREEDIYGGEAVTVIIYQNASSKTQRILNSEFQCVRIHYFPEEKDFWLECRLQPIEYATENYETIKYSEVAASKNTLTNAANFKGCELKYYYDTIIPDYYVPCYVFYNEITDSETNEVRYQATVEPMYKITE